MILILISHRQLIFFAVRKVDNLLIIRVLEFGILAIILLQIINAIMVTIKNKQSNTWIYAIAPQPGTSSLN